MAGRGRPRKHEYEEALQVVPLQEELGPRIKHLFMAISPTGRPNEFGAEPAEAVEAEVAKWIERGYQLVLVQHIRTERTEGMQVVGEQMLYVLVR